MILDSNFLTPQWIQAFGVLLGVPVAIWQILRLFRKNRDLERQIDALNSIVRRQDTLNNNFKDQISELSKRNDLAEESNKSLRELVEVQGKMFLKDEEYQERYMELV